MVVEFCNSTGTRKSFLTIGVANLIVVLGLAVYMWALWDHMAKERSRSRPEPAYIPAFWQLLEAPKPRWSYSHWRSFCDDQKDFFGKWTTLDKSKEWHFYPTREFKHVSQSGIQISDGGWKWYNGLYAGDIGLVDRISIWYFNLEERFSKIQYDSWIKNTSEDKMSVTLTNEETGEIVQLRKIVEEKDIDPYRYKTWLRE